MIIITFFAYLLLFVSYQLILKTVDEINALNTYCNNIYLEDIKHIERLYGIKI